MRRFLNWLIGTVVGLALANVGLAGERPQPVERKVAVPADATLQQVLDGLAIATGSLVLAERPVGKVGEERLRGRARSVAAAEALDLASDTFDLHALTSDGLIGFQKRYTRSDEPVDLTIEELTAVVNDIHRLAGPFDPGDVSVPSLRLLRFLQTFTPEQLRLARTSGLPFQRLRKEQRRAWVVLGTEPSYGTFGERFRRVREMLRNWERVRITAQREGQPGDDREGRQTLVMEFPDSQRAAAQHQVTIPLRGDGPVTGYPVGPSGNDLPDTKSPRILGLTGLVTLPGGAQTVRQIIGHVEAVTGKKLAVSRRDGERVLLTSAGPHPASRVLRTLEAVYGWELRQISREQLTLGRPRDGAARDEVDLHGKLVRAIPPSLHFLLQKRGPELAAWLTGHYAAEHPRVHERITGNWAAAQDLPANAQSRLALVSFVSEVRGDYQVAVRGGAPLHSASTPQDGMFKVDVTRRGDAESWLVSFLVNSPDGRKQSWAWGIDPRKLAVR